MLLFSWRKDGCLRDSFPGNGFLLEGHRSAHSPFLKSYQHRINPTDSPDDLCPDCLTPLAISSGAMQTPPTPYNPFSVELPGPGSLIARPADGRRTWRRCPFLIIDGNYNNNQVLETIKRHEAQSRCDICRVWTRNGWLRWSKQVLYHRLLIFFDPFTSRVCAYILLLLRFCSCALAFLQKFVHVLWCTCKILFTWPIFLCVPVFARVFNIFWRARSLYLLLS